MAGPHEHDSDEDVKPIIVQKVKSGRTLIGDIKTSSDRTHVYNDVKSDLIVFMITTSMFPTSDECLVQVYGFIHKSTQRWNIKNFDAETGFIKTVSLIFKLRLRV